MLKSIAQPSPDLQAFIQSFGHPLNQEQERHITQAVDALTTIDGRITLSSLYRAISGDPCPKAGADTVRVALWQVDDLCIPLLCVMNGQSRI